MKSPFRYLTPYLTGAALFVARYAGFTAASGSFDESGGSNTLALTVARSGDLAGALQINLVDPGGNGVDYNLSATQYAWADGEGGNKTITATAVADATTEGNEPFAFGLSVAVGTATISGNTTFTATLVDTSTTPAGGTVLFAEDFETLPTHDAYITQDAAGWDGNNAMRFTLPDTGLVNPDGDAGGGGDFGVTDWAIFGGGSPSHVFIGFASKMSANFSEAFDSLVSTSKQFIAYRDGGTPGDRVTQHIRRFAAGSPEGFNFMYVDHNTERSASQVLPRQHAIPVGDVNTATDTITETSHAHWTGNRLTYYADGGAPIGGLTVGQEYYVIVTDADHFQFAASFADALAGTEIDLTSTGTGPHTFRYHNCLFLAANVDKWFWHELELDLDNLVFRWWLTSADGMYNRPIQAGSAGTYANDAGHIDYESVPCVRRLIEEASFQGAGTGTYWQYVDMGYWRNWVNTSPFAYLVHDDLIVGDSADVVAAPAGFVV